MKSRRERFYWEKSEWERRRETRRLTRSSTRSLCVCPLFSCFTSLRFILLTKLWSRVFGCTVVYCFYTVDLDWRINGRWDVANSNLTNLLVVGVGVVGEMSTRPDPISTSLLDHGYNSEPDPPDNAWNMVASRSGLDFSKQNKKIMYHDFFFFSYFSNLGRSVLSGFWFCFGSIFRFINNNM